LNVHGSWNKNLKKDRADNLATTTRGLGIITFFKRNKFAQMERKSKTSFGFQSEQPTFGRELFGLQSKIGLAIKRTGNLISDRKIRI